MTGDKEIDNTVWYDMIINQVIENDESSKLATPFEEGSEAPSETSSNAPSKGTG